MTRELRIHHAMTGRLSDLNRRFGNAFAADPQWLAAKAETERVAPTSYFALR